MQRSQNPMASDSSLTTNQKQLKKVNRRSKQQSLKTKQPSSSTSMLVDSSAVYKRRRLHSLLPKLKPRCDQFDVPTKTDGSLNGSAIPVGPIQRFNKPARTYLTRPLRLYQLVASTSMEAVALANDSAVAEPPSATTLPPRVRPPRKLLMPLHRLEALDFDGQPVPTLGRLRLVTTDQDESLMRWQHLCLVCQQQCQSSSQLFSHMEAHSQAIQRASKHLLGGQIRCCLCLELVPTWKRFRTHLQRHVGYQPFRCKQCAEVFSTNGNLKRHIGRKHNRIEAIAADCL